jgi:hypothetical protein
MPERSGPWPGQRLDAVIERFNRAFVDQRVREDLRNDHIRSPRGLAPHRVVRMLFEHSLAVATAWPPFPEAMSEQPSRTRFAALPDSAGSSFTSATAAAPSPPLR